MIANPFTNPTVVWEQEGNGIAGTSGWGNTQGCITKYVYGCADPTASNYDPAADYGYMINDESCEYTPMEHFEPGGGGPDGYWSPPIAGIDSGGRTTGRNGDVKKPDPNAPKRLTPKQMAMDKFGPEVRGCNCRWSGWWSNWYCTGSNCQNPGALCWNNHAVCSERPPDPKDKHPKHAEY